MRARAFALALLLAALVPPTHAAGDAFRVPAPRAGDRAVFDLVIDYDGDVATHDASATYAWLPGIRSWTDAFGLAHEAYAIDEGSSIGPMLHDLATNERLGASSDASSETTFVQAGGVAAGSASRSGWRIPFPSVDGRVALSGRVLVPGEPFTLPVPVDPTSYDRYWPPQRYDLTPFGDDHGFFRVDAAPYTFVERFVVDGEPYDVAILVEQAWWFDGLSPVPVAYEVNETSGGEWYAQTFRLRAFTPGSGEVLEDADYHPPPRVERRPDAALSAYTRDGPNEPVLGSLSLPRAVAALRADARASAFFATEDALLLSASFEESPTTLLVTWTLQYASPGARLTGTLQAPWVPGRESPAARVTAVSFQGPPPRDSPSAAEMVGARVGCAAEAFRQASARVPAGFAVVAKSGSFEAQDKAGEPDVACWGGLQSMMGAPVLGPSSAGIASMGANAQAYGRTGGLGQENWGDDATGIRFAPPAKDVLHPPFARPDARVLPNGQT